MAADQAALATAARQPARDRADDRQTRRTARQAVSRSSSANATKRRPSASPANLERMVPVRQRLDRPDDAVGATGDGQAEIRRRARFPRPGDHLAAQLCRRLEPARHRAFHDDELRQVDVRHRPYAGSSSRAISARCRAWRRSSRTPATSSGARGLAAGARDLPDDAQRPDQVAHALGRARRRRHLNAGVQSVDDRHRLATFSPMRLLDLTHDCSRNFADLCSAAVGFLLRPRLRPRRRHPRRRLADRAPQPAGRAFRDRRAARASTIVHVPAPARPTLPPIVFIHGASANLQDQMVPLRPLLEGRAELLFFDRPGHGWSERGPATTRRSGRPRRSPR